MPTMAINIRTQEKVAEISWFCDLCNGDTRYLGTEDASRSSSFGHCRDILLTAQAAGFSNILLPSSYIVGQDPIAFASAISREADKINLLVAIRTGELHPPMLARSLATLDHLLQGRLTVNIINSDLPGLKEDGELRYGRSREVIEILKAAWTQDRIKHQGQLYGFDLDSTPSKPYQQNGGPLLYFGGISDGARDLCAEHCDVFLMWPETQGQLQATMQDVSQRATTYGRRIDFGLRIHVVVRETEKEAREYARSLMSKYDEAEGLRLKERAQDAHSLGVQRQNEERKLADADGFVEPLLWTEIGKARSGCGAALVGSAEQVIEKINSYMDMGFRAFIFSGYPLIEECHHFSKLVLPSLPNVKLSVLQGRTPSITPKTPLTTQLK
ncbi:MAG: LLM class flavin-dependent oxidoreductase [Chitinophagales bacterium]|nr:LLM class flavin-dependent oxidoreductase [Chitinophagales bacterium]